MFEIKWTGTKGQWALAPDIHALHRLVTSLASLLPDRRDDKVSVRRSGYAKHSIEGSTLQEWVTALDNHVDSESKSNLFGLILEASADFALTSIADVTHAMDNCSHYRTREAYLEFRMDQMEPNPHPFKSFIRKNLRLWDGCEGISSSETLYLCKTGDVVVFHG